MKRTKVTQAALARELGVPDSTVSRWTRGIIDKPDYVHVRAAGMIFEDVDGALKAAGYNDYETTSEAAPPPSNQELRAELASLREGLAALAARVDGLVDVLDQKRN